MLKSNPGSRAVSTTAGILFIVGLAAGIGASAALEPILNSPDPLGMAAVGSAGLYWGAALWLLMAYALAMVPILLYPLLKERQPRLALAYAIFRGAMETGCYVISALCWILLARLGGELVGQGTQGEAAIRAIVDLLLRADDLPYIAFAFPIGAACFYLALLRARLVPRWISVWGLVAALLSAVAGFLQLFGLADSSSLSDTLLNLPLFFQESVMSIWFIAKGFSVNRS